MFKLFFFATLFATTFAIPFPRFVGISGAIPSGAGFSSFGNTVAGAAADENSGIAGGSLQGIGSILGLAGPGLATAAALASPSA